MALARKAFRVEAMLGVGSASQSSGGVHSDAIMSELAEIKKLTGEFK